jgi:hypothetical protein
MELAKPDLSSGEMTAGEENHNCMHLGEDDRLFGSCVVARRDFHIDPCGKMSFCCFFKDPRFRYDLRKGNFRECWEVFIPSLAEKIGGGTEYLENCGTCDDRSDCKWCPVYGYLEHRRFSAKVEYLCAVAQETKRLKQNWAKNHRRYYHIGGITVQLDSDLPITDSTFNPKLKLFQVDGPGEDNISIRHRFSLPNLNGKNLGKQFYRKVHWAIYRKRDSWIYLDISKSAVGEHVHRVVFFNRDHTRTRVFNKSEDIFRKGNLDSLTLFPTDEVLLAPILADREGCCLHSAGLLLGNKGFLFVGHSGAGKSTITTMLKHKMEILCDDRMILRRSRGGFRIHGTWNHSTVPEVSAASAPLRGIMLLEQATENRLILLDNKIEIIRRLLACIIRPLVTAEWWEKTLSLVEKIAREVPCYVLQFDKSGEVVDVLADELLSP